jgi:hypothetical protein
MNGVENRDAILMQWRDVWKVRALAHNAGQPKNEMALAPDARLPKKGTCSGAGRRPALAQYAEQSAPVNPANSIC